MAKAEKKSDEEEERSKTTKTNFWLLRLQHIPTKFEQLSFYHYVA